MRCPGGDDWMLLAANQLGEAEARRGRDHMERCGGCRESFDQARRDHVMLKHLYKAMDRRHDALRDQLMAALPRAGHRSASTGSPRGWRPAILRTAWAAAAAAIVVVTAFLLVGQSEAVAFARVVEQLQDVETIACHMIRTITGGERRDVVRARLYLSRQYGAVTTFEVHGLNVLTVWAPAGQPVVSVKHGLRSYTVLRVSDDDPAPPRRVPIEQITGLRNLSEDAGEALGERLLGGRRVTGFRVPGEKLGSEDPTAYAEIWVGNDSRLPVKVTFNAAWSETGLRVIQIYDSFQWNPPLHADLFEPEIPEGYARIDIDLPRADEAALIEGLRIFAELAEGAYPESLNQIRAQKQIESVFLERFGDQASRLEAADPLYGELSQQSTLVLNACRFYAGLVKNGRDPQYFGADVRAGDAENVLVAWRLDDGRRRAIYGDLSAATLPVEPDASSN